MGTMLTLPVLYDELWDSPKMIITRIQSILDSMSDRESDRSLPGSRNAAEGVLRSIAVMAIANRNWHALPADIWDTHQHLPRETTLQALCVGNMFAFEEQLRPLQFLKFWEELAGMMDSPGDHRIDLFLCEGIAERSLRSFALGIPVMGKAQHAALRAVSQDLQVRPPSSFPLSLVCAVHLTWCAAAATRQPWWIYQFRQAQGANSCGSCATGA